MDVPDGAWYISAVDYVLIHNIMSGNTNGTFAPEKALTRAELVTLLWSKEGKPEAILEKIAEGKMRKFFEENTLLNQELVGEKKTIAQYIHEADKEATVVAYKRFALES